jgi:antitoxin (DNA-binding transcriptional repressor) of toxin-antitoxin stability system
MLYISWYGKNVSTVRIHDLRQHLASFLALAERGERILVMRRDQAVAELGPVRASGRHIGEQFGNAQIVASTIQLRPGAVASALAEDRSDDR